MPDEPIHFGAYPHEWDHFCTLGLREFLLPVVSNPIAVKSPQSSLEQLGKVPSRYNKKGQVIGFPNWTSHIATDDEIARWSRNEDYSMCMQTLRVRGADIDVPDKLLARTIVKFIVDLGYRFPARIRSNSGKVLLAFAVEGDLRKRTMKVEGGIIEFLGTGQQFVCCGTHPSGVRYEWVTDKGPALPDEFPVISVEDFEKLWSALVEKFAIEAPTEAGGARKNDPTDAAKALKDPVLHFLAEHGDVLDYGRNNEVHITCPWKAEHTTENGPTETTYFPAGTRGYQQGHFKCLHAHCARRTDHEFLEKFGYYVSDFEDLTTPEEKIAEAKKRERFEPIKPSEYMKRPPPAWLIKGILPKGETMLFGASGAGKTFAALDMACHLALGMPWNGRKTVQTAVTYVCAEGQGGFRTRLEAWCVRHCIDVSELDGWLSIMPDTPNFLSEDEVRLVAEKIMKHGGTGLIIVDTLAQVTAGADENSSQEMGKALRHAKLLISLTNSSYMLVHHTGKDEERGARGSSVIKGQLDAMFYVFKEGEQHTLHVEKMKDGKDGFGFNFKLGTETLGHDEDGDAITSCTVEYDGAANETRKKKIVKRGRWQRIVLEAWEALGGGNCLVSDISEEAMRMIPADPGKDKRDRRQEYIILALENLAREGMFTMRDAAIWVDLAA